MSSDTFFFLSHLKWQLLPSCAQMITHHEYFKYRPIQCTTTDVPVCSRLCHALDSTKHMRARTDRANDTQMGPHTGSVELDPLEGCWFLNGLRD